MTIGLKPNNNSFTKLFVDSQKYINTASVQYQTWPQYNLNHQKYLLHYNKVFESIQQKSHDALTFFGFLGSPFLCLCNFCWFSKEIKGWLLWFLEMTSLVRFIHCSDNWRRRHCLRVNPPLRVLWQLGTTSFWAGYRGLSC